MGNADDNILVHPSGAHMTYLALSRMPIALLALALLTSPAVSVAQGGSSGRVIITNGGPTRRTAPITARDINTFDPVALLLGKAKDLKVTPAQESQLATLAASIKTTRDSLFKAVQASQKNSLALSRFGGSNPPPQIEAKADSAEDATTGLLVQIRDLFAHAADQALAMLDDPQRPAAHKALDDLAKQMKDTPLGKAGQGAG